MKPLIARDLLLSGAALLLLALSPPDPWLQASWLKASWLQAPWSQVSFGVLLGYVAYAFHEWAHLAGAWWSGAQVNLARSVFSPFLFSFDSEQNSKQQFFAMTLPGFLATAVYVVVYWLWLPTDQLWGEVALIAALALASLTLVIEGPIALVAMVGAVPAVEIPGLGQNRTLMKLRRLLATRRD